MEYLGNQLLDPSLIVNLSLDNQSMLYKFFKWRRPPMEDDLKHFKLEIYQQTIIWSSSSLLMTFIYDNDISDKVLKSQKNVTKEKYVKALMSTWKHEVMMNIIIESYNFSRWRFYSLVLLVWLLHEMWAGWADTNKDLHRARSCWRRRGLCWTAPGVPRLQHTSLSRF